MINNVKIKKVSSEPTNLISTNQLQQPIPVQKRTGKWLLVTMVCHILTSADRKTNMTSNVKRYPPPALKYW